MNVSLDTKNAITELVEKSKLKAGDLVVVGCSSSEILGEHIGKGSSPETGVEVATTILSVLNEKGIFLAAQCCEHLNRALVIEREAAEKFMLEEVCVRPMPKAGGSFATAVYDNMKDPVVVEHVKAKAGLDIGCTLIGMHLKDVAVPLRLTVKTIGCASINAAYTRPKLIGGVRAHYPE
ncbi:MAG TPA: TIGR01440 family protein [Clostridiales bacterium]|nr:TIGR01440 family protein [Clostridiales bacterium]